MKYLMNLQLFAEEVATAADTGGAEAETGSLATDTGSGQAAETTDRKTFEELISGDYKQDYTNAVAAAVNKRMKNANEKAKRQQSILDNLTPVMEMMGKRYGVDTSDMANLDYEGLSKKIMDDNMFYEEEALQRGMDVDTYKQMVKMERDNARLRREQAETQTRNENARKYESVINQANEAKALYPSLDIDEEMKNPTFERMVWASGVPVRTAYEVVHKDEIFGNAMQYATQKTAQMMSNAIQSGKKRPDEVGLSGQSSATASADSPRYWDKAKRDEIKRRVLAGEKVVL